MSNEAVTYSRGRTYYVAGVGILFDHGTTVPTDGTSDYAPGCIFQDTDAAADASFLINQGTLASCNFDAIDVGTILASNVPILDTAGWFEAENTETVLAEIGALLRVATTAGITTGVVCCKKIASAQLELLLDGNENDLFAVNEGDVILKVELVIQATAGAACAVTIGTDVDVDGTTKDPDSLLKAGDANATGIQASDDVAGTYLGADLAFGSLTADDDGYVTITSGADKSDSSFVGEALMYYIPA